MWNIEQIQELIEVFSGAGNRCHNYGVKDPQNIEMYKQADMLLQQIAQSLRLSLPKHMSSTYKWRAW